MLIENTNALDCPSERDSASDTLEKRLWNTADQFRANSGLTAAQYSAPVLGLILFAETRFVQRHAALLPSPAGGTAEGGGEGAFPPSTASGERDRGRR